MNEALHLEYTVHAMAIVCAKLSSANLEEGYTELEKTEVGRENNH